MGFGRSNSLSLNTGAVNSSFAAQPQQSGGLFGNTPSVSLQQVGANTQTSRPQAGGSLFGGSLFGGQNQQQTSQPAQQPTATTGGGGLFGGSLFGGQNQQQSTQQQQPAQQQQTGGPSLFGGGGGGSGLFGQQPAQSNNMNQSTSLFGNSTQQQSQSQFGLPNPNLAPMNANTRPLDQPSQTSLLSASRYAQSQYQPFVTGRLSMGQGAAAQPTTTPATKLDWRNVKPNTRFNDLTDAAKSDLQQIETLILEQEDFCRKIEALLPNHEANVKTLAPDVRLISDKVEDVDQSLQADAQGVQSAKAVQENDISDLLRCARIVENLKQPAQYAYAPAANSGRLPTASWDSSYDVDLISNYFQPLMQSMQSLIATYDRNLAEIESHMETVEDSARAQMQAVGQSGQRREVGGDSVRQLAETLRGFEESILAAAGKVGACREGVTELVLGQAAGRGRGRAW